MITFNGGKVTIRIIGGKKTYRGSLRNGVKSATWGSCSSSFVFVGKPSKGAVKAAKAGGPAISWSQNAYPYQREIGKKYKFYFPAGGSLGGPVYGTKVYTTGARRQVWATSASLIAASTTIRP